MGAEPESPAKRPAVLSLPHLRVLAKTRLWKPTFRLQLCSERRAKVGDVRQISRKLGHVLLKQKNGLDRASSSSVKTTRRQSMTLGGGEGAGDTQRQSGPLGTGGYGHINILLCDQQPS